MKKKVKIIIGLLIIIAIVVFAVFYKNYKIDKKTENNVEQENVEKESVVQENIGQEENINTSKSNLNIENVENLKELVNEIYTGLEDSLPKLMTNEIDINDNEQFKFATGLESAEEIEYGVISEPMMSSQAYSLVLLKVKDGADANQIAKKMSETIDTRKWICVSAEKLYSTNSENIVCLVMSSEEWAKPVYEKFKSLAGEIGQEYEKTEQL